MKLKKVYQDRASKGADASQKISKNMQKYSSHIIVRTMSMTRMSYSLINKAYHDYAHSLAHGLNDLSLSRIDDYNVCDHQILFPHLFSSIQDPRRLKDEMFRLFYANDNYLLNEYECFYGYEFIDAI
jgi:hypothetical protein